ncbi:RNA-binding domain-containing protein [Ascobolus immersus RN42]|uniref:RNA-binding domain-containing protein n=1 Tax=Ascobolus immersus RN42 TaxID=1160509 RepID=A0A3N4IN51_ASCIM|nr:RNA-binding domain-containing protein [Ascobolus immersus RN42]
MASDTSRLPSTLHIGNLSPYTTQPTLHSLFLPFGPIVEISLPAPPEPNNPHAINAARQTGVPQPLNRGFAYVEFENEEDAKAAIDNLDYATVDGKTVRVSKAKTKEVETEGLGSKKAVWEQEGWLSKNVVGEEDKRAIEEEEKGVSLAEQALPGGIGVTEAGPRIA